MGHLGKRHKVRYFAEGKRHGVKGQNHALGSRALNGLHAGAPTLQKPQRSSLTLHYIDLPSHEQDPYCQPRQSTNARLELVLHSNKTEVANNANTLLMAKRHACELARPISMSPLCSTVPLKALLTVPLVAPLVAAWPLVAPFCCTAARALALRKLAPVKLSQRSSCGGPGGLGNFLHPAITALSHKCPEHLQQCYLGTQSG